MTDEPRADPSVEERPDGVEVEEPAAAGSSAAPTGPRGSFGGLAGESSDATEVETDAADRFGDLGDDLGRAQADAARAQQDVASLTADLQRLQAEYLNYKRRVERDRELVRENATYSALVPITEVLDTIDRARDHGPLEDGFRAVADQLERTVAGLGLTKFGQPGDPFDPRIHEALSHIGEDPTVLVTTCRVVARSGYRIGDRVVRAAQVLVVDPAPSHEERAAGRDEPGAEPGVEPGAEHDAGA